MNKNLKLTLKNRSSEQGFAIPIAVGMGLIMILVGTTMIVRSQGDEVTALTQKATNRGLSAAETGISRYQSLIYKNRVIATYKDCDGARNSSGVCPDTGTTKSWANAAQLAGIASCGGGGATVVTANSTTAWRDVSTEDLNGNGTLDAGEDLNGNGTIDRDPSLGQYRLVSYVYPAPGATGIVGTAPGICQLTVEGRVNQSGTGNTATIGAGTATTRLQVNIPVEAADLNSVPIPGAFIKKGGTGQNAIIGNVLLNDCNASPGDVKIAEDPATRQPYLDPNTGEPYKAQHTSAIFPPLPTQPTIITSPNNQNLGTLSSKVTLTLPKPGDKTTDSNGVVDPNGVYRYSVTSITMAT